jgi:A/G-specific adenine glycosylase
MSLTHLIQWSQSQFSHLPWRKNRTLYRTLVSEIMLQQTTVGTVKNHFERFIERFPDLESLALASESELLVAWKGLGYYRRAKNLKKIAEALFKEHAGKFPKQQDQLQLIPGIGPYTSSAILAIGMDLPALAIDANLERVIARLYGIKIAKGPQLHRHIQELFLAKKIFSKVSSYRALNEALMDLGRNYCQARKASCDLCPMSKECAAANLGKPLQFPLDNKEKRKNEEHEIHLLRFYVIKNNKLLAYKKNEAEWLSGQYEVPTAILKTTDVKLKQYPKIKETKFAVKYQFKTGITKYTIINHVVILKESEIKKWKLWDLEWRDWQSEHANLSTATIKGLKKLISN